MSNAYWSQGSVVVAFNSETPTLKPDAKHSSKASLIMIDSFSSQSAQRVPCSHHTVGEKFSSNLL